MSVWFINRLSRKAFISIITLFFISIFLLFSFTSYPNPSINEFILIDQAETQKTGTIKDVER
jgi:ATP/ADP translocase